MVVDSVTGEAPTRIAQWMVRYLRLAAGFGVLLLAVLLVVDLRTAPPRFTFLALHLLRITVVLLYLIVAGGRRFEAFWRPATFVMVSSLLLADAGLSLSRGADERFVIEAILTLMGCAAFVPWGVRWQMLLAAIAFSALALDCTFGAPDADALNHWTELGGAAGLACCASMLGGRYRRELSKHLQALRQQAEQERELARREATVAHREQLAAQVAALRETQTMLRAEFVERETAQHQLEANETATRRIYDAALETIVINRLCDGVFVDVNQEFTRCYGYTRDEVIGKSAATLGLWRNQGQLKRFMAELRTNGILRNFATELCAKNGRIVPIVTSAVVVEIHGEPCVVGLARDVTEPRKAEREILAAREAALAASRAKSEFLSSMSHEIRTPMNAILGMAEVLAETPLSDEQRRFVETMRNNGAALLDLIDGILDLAKVESGRLSLETTEFDLCELVERVVETLGIRAYAKGLELVSVIAPHLPRVLVGDPLRLRQILINLLGNAIKFTAEGSVVLTVSGRIDDSAEHATTPSRPKSEFQELDFAVSDTGIGIPPETLAELFAPFTQADSSTARKYGGSGLGLSIVKRLVELMGGEIGVTSEPGRGSTFRFALRLEVAANPAARAAIAATSLDGKRIFVADPHPMNRLVLRQWAESHDAEEIETADTERVIGLICRQSLDLAFLDCRVDEADVFEIARSLVARGDRDREGRPPAIILMLTPNELGAQIDRMRAMGIGAAQRCYYLVKPLKNSEIARVVGLAFDPEGAVNEPPPNAPAMPTISASAKPVTPLRILVADDSPDNRMLIQAFLRHLPHQLDFAEDGAVAIDRAKAHRYQVILMDIQMPTVDGYTATRAIREWETAQSYPRSRIIALTASALGDAVRKSLAAGCDAHIAKPVNKATLIAALEGVTNSNEAPARDEASP